MGAPNLFKTEINTDKCPPPVSIKPNTAIYLFVKMAISPTKNTVNLMWAERLFGALSTFHNEPAESKAEITAVSCQWIRFSRCCPYEKQLKTVSRPKEWIDENYHNLLCCQFKKNHLLQPPTPRMMTICFKISSHLGHVRWIQLTWT